MRAWILCGSLALAAACASSRTPAPDDAPDIMADAMPDQPCSGDRLRPLPVSRFAAGERCFESGEELDGLCAVTSDSVSGTGELTCIIGHDGAAYAGHVRWGETISSRFHHGDSADLGSTLTEQEQERCDAMFAALREPTDAGEPLVFGETPRVGPACPD